jgi:RHS repeat-associated protein
VLLANVTCTWDNNGNLLYDGSANYLYDRANRLISTTLNSTTSLFNYNGDGVRLKQVVAGAVTTYTQDLAAPLPVVLQSKTGITTTKYLYSIGTRPVAQNTIAWEYLLPDALGSVRQTANASGYINRTQDYEPYGSVLDSSGSGQSVYGFTGEERDQSGLIFLRARYMQSNLGIFTSRDPWSGDQLRPGSMNGWGYTDGNPINSTDPSGLLSAAEKICADLGWKQGWFFTDFYCVPIVEGNNHRTVGFLRFLSSGMVISGWPHGAYNLRHYIDLSDPTDVIFSSKWYLDETPNNEPIRSWLQYTLDDIEPSQVCVTWLRDKPVSHLFDAMGDVKSAIGRHFVYAQRVAAHQVLPQGCDCLKRKYYIQFYIDDPYDYDVNDPADTESPQYLSTSAGPGAALGIGNTPFLWLYRLANNDKEKLAHEFHTKIYWAIEIDEESHTRQILHDSDMRKGAFDGHVQVTLP